MNNLSIQKASINDATILASFMNSIEKESLEFLIPFEYEFTEDIQRKHIEHFSKTENAYLLIAKELDVIIGALDFMPYNATLRKHVGRD